MAMIFELLVTSDTQIYVAQHRTVCVYIYIHIYFITRVLVIAFSALTQCNTLIIFFFNQSVVDLLLCFGSLFCSLTQVW